MNNITIHVELGPESKALLNKLLTVLDKPATGCHCHQDAPTVPQQPEHTNDAPQEPVAPSEEPAPEETTKYTIDQVSKLVQMLAGPKTEANPYGGKRNEARAIVKKYAEKVGAIPADKIDEVMAQLMKLKEESENE